MSQNLKDAKEKYLRSIIEKNGVWSEVFVIPSTQRQLYYADTQDVEYVELSEIVLNNPRIVILGNHGSGTTTSN